MTANMTEENKPHKLAPQEESEVDSGELNRRLLTRVGIAVVLILALLGGLAMLDSMNAPPPAKPAEVVAEAPTRPTSNSANDGSSAPALQVPPLTEEKPADQTAQAATEETTKMGEAGAAASVGVAAAPETSAPPTMPGSVPLRADAVEQTGRPLTKPATARLAMMKPSEATIAAKPLERPQPAAELTRQANPPHTGAPAARPLTQAAARSVGGGAYLVQLGVFSSTAHAEELRAKLELNGIAAQIEARVQVGPFSSREEADQMRDKLRKLGLEGGVLVATKK